MKRRKFYEVQDFFRDISKYENALSAPIKNDVAIVYDYDSLASFRIQSQSILLDCQREMENFYKAFYDRNAGVDIIPEDRSFDGYKVVILSQMIITKPEMENKVRAFAENGIKTIPTAYGVEAVERGTGDDKILMLINHNASQAEAMGETLAPFECRIIS